MFWKPCSSCWSSHLLREEFLSALIYSTPLWLPDWSFNWYQSWLGSSLSLTSIRSKDGILGTGFGYSALRWEELPDVVEADDSLPLWKGSNPLGHYGEHSLSSSD
jgi:hypothetical protein